MDQATSVIVACSKRSDSGERCEVKKAMKSRGGLPRFYFFALLFSSHRSPLSECLEQASVIGSPANTAGNPNTVLANRIIKCIYAVLLANKIIRCIYLCSCVFMSRFGRDLNPIRDG